MYQPAARFLILFSFPIYILIHFYVYIRLAALLGFTTATFLFFMVLIGLGYSLGRVWSKRRRHPFARSLLYLGGLWFGWLLFITPLLVLYDLLSIFLTLPKEQSGIFLIALSFLLCVISIIQAYWVRSKHVRIVLPKLKKKVRVAMTCDLHLGNFHGNRLLKHTVQQINKAQPDFAVIVGDLVDDSKPLYKEELNELHKLVVPTFFSMGNHEWYYGEKKIMDLIKHTPLRVLRNAITEICGVQLIGIDFPHQGSFKEAHPLQHLSLDPNKPSILLHHAPDHFDIAVKKNIDLVLAGHTHKGQLIQYAIVPWLMFRHVAGLHKKENTLMYISQGTGTSGVPMRFGTMSEVTILDLVPDFSK